MGVHDEAERVEVESVEQWRAWLEANHGQAEGVWLVTFKRASPRPTADYVALVEESLCFGWIDGTARTVDDERSMLWLAPRRKGSVWAASNRERVERLEREGRLWPTGQAVADRARADGSWSILIPAERGEVPDDLAVALDEQLPARATWEAYPPSVRLQALSSIYMAKRPDTRAKRVAVIVERAAAGERPF